ncbi:MAG: formate dehydrogenase subunit alpha, partial [Thermoleophilia bacterium]|nr:formate dehydrogenase subunit alpha [Thermoleophilia bacterium]
LPGNAREDLQIVIDLAKAMGGSWPEYRTAEDVWNEFADLAPLWSGIRYDRIEEVGLQWPCTDRDDPGSAYLHAPRPARPSGKAKFYPVEYQPPIEEPDSEYPFVLSTGRTLYHYNSATMTMREEGVTQKQEDPFVEMSPEDAANLGVAHGDWVRLVSRRGEIEARAAIGNKVYPGLVWMALHFAESRVNLLTNDVTDSLIGIPEYKVCAIRIEPVRPGLRAAAR